MNTIKFSTGLHGCHLVTFIEGIPAPSGLDFAASVMGRTNPTPWFGLLVGTLLATERIRHIGRDGAIDEKLVMAYRASGWEGHNLMSDEWSARIMESVAAAS